MNECKPLAMGTVLALCARFPRVQGLHLGLLPMADARLLLDSPVGRCRLTL